MHTAILNVHVIDGITVFGLMNPHPAVAEGDLVAVMSEGDDGVLLLNLDSGASVALDRSALEAAFAPFEF